MDLSIIIPVYNGALLLNRCLNSVFSQTTKYSYEVIIIDDGSTDNSVELVKSRKEPNIVLFQQQNAGPAMARNKGIELASGKYIAFLDADDYWNDGYINQTINFLEQNKECVAATVGQCIKNTSGDSVIPNLWVKAGKDFVLTDFFTEWSNNQFVGTCSTTMRIDSVRMIGGQRLDLRCMEDWNFWFRLASCGKWGFIASVLYVSDGLIATPSNKSWCDKMKKRWANTPYIEEWEKDILNKFHNKIPKGYYKARGYIVRVMAYGHLMSGHISESRQETIKYGRFFPNDSISKLMNICKNNKITWYMLCKFLRWRELHRSF